jgi:hypothetical protein
MGVMRSHAGKIVASPSVKVLLASYRIKGHFPGLIVFSPIPVGKGDFTI